MTNFSYSLIDLITLLFNLSSTMLAILSMHEIVRVLCLVLNQQPKVKWWWTILQSRAVIPDFLDLILVSRSLLIGPSLFITAYNIYKLSLLLPLLLEGFLTQDKVVDNRWWVGLVIYCLMLLLNIIITSVVFSVKYLIEMY